jgi:spore maturation protein CgeB
MANVGFSPPTRVFEAAGAGACMITDAWTGIENFFVPEKEILVASSAEEIVRYLRKYSLTSAASIGEAMRNRALRDHTYGLRALQFQRIVEEDFARRRTRGSEIESMKVVQTGP